MKQLEEAKNVASSMKVELEADIKRVRSEAAASEDRLRSEIGTLQSRTSDLLDQVKTAEGEMEELRQADLRSQELLAMVNSQMETVLSEKLELEASNMQLVDFFSSKKQILNLFNKIVFLLAVQKCIGPSFFKSWCISE